jgi:hypothetical protein
MPLLYEGRQTGGRLTLLRVRHTLFVYFRNAPFPAAMSNTDRPSGIADTVFFVPPHGMYRFFCKTLTGFTVLWYMNKRSFAWRGKTKAALNQKGLQGEFLWKTVKKGGDLP